MRKGWTLAMCGGVGLLGLTVWASEKAPVEFANAMRVSAAAKAAATAAMKEENFDEVEKQAAIIVEAFPAIEKYFAVRSPDVLPMVRIASKAASEMREAEEVGELPGEWGAAVVDEALDQEAVDRDQEEAGELGVAGAEEAVDGGDVGVGGRAHAGERALVLAVDPPHLEQDQELAGEPVLVGLDVGEQGGEAQAGVGGQVGVVGDGAEVLGRDGAHDGVEEGVFAGEVVVEGAGRDAERRGDLAHGQRGVAAVGEQAHAAVDEAVAHVGVVDDLGQTRDL